MVVVEGRLVEEEEEGRLVVEEGGRLVVETGEVRRVDREVDLLHSMRKAPKVLE